MKDAARPSSVGFTVAPKYLFSLFRDPGDRIISEKQASHYVKRYTINLDPNGGVKKIRRDRGRNLLVC
jgi:hypothetical protein